MKISYPIRDKDGKEFRSLDEIMQRIDAEAHGTWLLGGNGLWHGAVHISEVSNPRSALTPDTLSTGEPVPLQFMADGTIAAYRINNDYLKDPYKGQELRYSSTFVLVKSQCQPDPQKEKSWLEFYSLYMHLAPVKDYPASLCYKVRAGHSGILLRKYTSGQNGLPETQESGDPVIYQAPPKTRNSLKAGDRFASSCTGRFYVTRGEQSTLMTFGLVRLLNGETAENEQYWVTLDPTLMEPDGEIQALMPAWMQKAKAKGVFDQVQAGGETEEWQVSAGTPVGFMGCEEYPGKEGSQTEREWFVHLEVLSADPRMPAFLGNPEGVKGEKRTVRAPKGKILYTRQATAEQATFSATSATLEAQYMLPRITTTPVMDASKQWWFNITGSGWLPETDVEEAGQYDLLKQGFQPLEENSGGDMVSSPYEGWVPEAFDSVSRAAAQGDEWYEQVPPFYRELMVRMDSDQDGKVTEEEIRQALV
ncbi:TPA_asm: chitinase, partial [Salmonella enterica subsp. houtenae serovar 44:z36[z38]:-]|nr:chitinase [Salmonella enterica subsp. houtenae serovar 44:z36[z38]:-]